MHNKRDLRRESMDQNEKIEAAHLPQIFHKVAKRVHSFLNKLRKQAPPESIEYLRFCFSSTECPHIDYDRFAAPFAYSYFLKNFWKATGIFLEERPPLARSVVDAGCGSGATILAYLAFLDDSLVNTKWDIKVILMDRSKVQLKLARELLENVWAEFKNLSITTEFKCVDLRQWQPEERSADSILFGHVLTENRASIATFLEKAFSSVSENGRVYIVERTDDKVWPLIDEYKSDMALPACDGIIQLDTKDIHLPRLAGTERRAYIKTRFLALHVPERKILVSLLRLYFQVWKTKSLTGLECLFAPQAEYHDKPYQAPYRGIEQIKQYWRDNVLEQEDIQLRLLRVAYTGTDAFTEWSASFRRSKQRVLISGALILKVDPNICRVTALHEYYQSLKYEE